MHRFCCSLILLVATIGSAGAGGAVAGHCQARSASGVIQDNPGPGSIRACPRADTTKGETTGTDRRAGDALLVDQLCRGVDDPRARLSALTR